MIPEVLALIADTEVLARIGGSLGEAARDRAREIAKLDEKTSRATRASWLASARVPITPGLRGIDASWIEAAIAHASEVSTSEISTSEISTSEISTSEISTSEISTSGASTNLTATSTQDLLVRRARRVLLDGPSNEVDVWLARFVCASLPPMPSIDATMTRPRSMEHALSMSAPHLRAWLEEVGADQIAFAVGQAAGAPTTRLGAASVRIQQAPRVGELGQRRAAIERARITIDESALARVGARSIAPHTNHLERVQLAHRLPRNLRLLDELEAFATSAGPPSWRALAAP